jgi:hypothetical protein
MIGIECGRIWYRSECQLVIWTPEGCLVNRVGCLWKSPLFNHGHDHLYFPSILFTGMDVSTSKNIFSSGSMSLRCLEHVQQVSPSEDMVSFFRQNEAFWIHICINPTHLTDCRHTLTCRIMFSIVISFEFNRWSNEWMPKSEKKSRRNHKMTPLWIITE